MTLFSWKTNKNAINTSASVSIATEKEQSSKNYDLNTLEDILNNSIEKYKSSRVNIDAPLITSIENLIKGILNADHELKLPKDHNNEPEPENVSEHWAIVHIAEKSISNECDEFIDRLNEIKEQINNDDAESYSGYESDDSLSSTESSADDDVLLKLSTEVLNFYRSLETRNESDDKRTQKPR